MMFNAIAKQLNEEGIPSPGKLRYERGATRVETYKDALWLRGTIRKITGDMVYTGCRIHGKIKRERLGGNKKRRPPEDWQILENAHPAIVSKELFEKVQAFNQAELARRGAFEKRDGSGPDFRGIFAGKVFCETAAHGCPPASECSELRAAFQTRSFLIATATDPPTTKGAPAIISGRKP